MKRIIVFILLSFCIASTHAQIRKTKWGMTKSQVMATESTKPQYTEHDFLSYAAYLSGKKVNLYYLFNKDGRLYRIGYYLNEKYVNDNNYLNTLFEFNSSLKEKYGDDPILDVKWNNNLYKDDEDKWGLAISAGHLEVSYFWDLEDTEILSKINGEEFKIDVSIMYTSKEFYQEKKRLEDF